MKKTLFFNIAFILCIGQRIYSQVEFNGIAVDIPIKAIKNIEVASTCLYPMLAKSISELDLDTYGEVLFLKNIACLADSENQLVSKEEFMFNLLINRGFNAILLKDQKRSDVFVQCSGCNKTCTPITINGKSYIPLWSNRMVSPYIYKENKWGRAIESNVIAIPKTKDSICLTNYCIFFNDTCTEISLLFNPYKVNFIKQIYRVICDSIFIPKTSSEFIAFCNSLNLELGDKSNENKINVILNICQQLKYNHSQWDNTIKLPDVSLAYKEGDCKDKSILFATLIHFVLGLDVKLIDIYESNHMVAAVNINNQIAGNSFKIDNVNFIAAEPSGVGYILGEISDEDIGRKYRTISVIFEK
jgi:hypothetical protein